MTTRTTSTRLVAALAGMALCLGGFAAATATGIESGARNPLFRGADPHALVIGRTFWVYPTFSLRSGEEFYAFSSTNLTDWQRHGPVLRFVDIPWIKADGQSRHGAWAPAVAERGGKFFFYYSVGPQDVTPSRIGVAVGDNPAGPFKDSGKPLLTGGNGFEAIDPMVFTDPKSGKSYLYAGGSAGAKLRVFELNDDWVSFAREVPVETPPKFTEGVFMHERNGTYYLSYSHGGWRDASYSVHYATAETPVGPWRYRGAILTSDARHKGPGHHSFIRDPATGEWFIFYHRWEDQAGDGPYRGARQICVDRIQYDSAGLLTPVVMSEKRMPSERTPRLVLLDGANDVTNATITGTGGSSSHTNGSLRLQVPAGQGVTIRLTPPTGVWNFSDYGHVAFELRNLGVGVAHLRCFIGNEGATDWSNSAIQEGFLPAGGAKTFRALLFRPASELKKFPALELFGGMNGLPGGFLRHWHTVQPADVRFIQLSVFPAKEALTVELVRVAAAAPLVPPLLETNAAAFLPFVDGFGQFKHADWQGKIHSESELKQAAGAEAADLRAYSSPPDWNEFGGWAGGPQLEATGHFRTEKRDGKWWLVDPKGRLFWSLGVNAVGVEGGGTPLAARERWFEDLPQPKGEFAPFFRRAGTAEASFDFGSANRFRKFGADWRTVSADLIHTRFRSWGVNTLGAWSGAELCVQRRTPYVVMLGAWGDTIQRRAPDPFDESFRRSIAQQLAAQTNSVRDPWCIGYFVENEIEWTSAAELVGAVLQQSPPRAAKRVLVEFLRQRHGEIAALNAAWETSFQSWGDLLAAAAKPDYAKARADFDAFYSHLLETWYRMCREEIRRGAPGKLYLGSRLHKHNDAIIAAAAKYCDVLSYNLYRNSLEGFGFKGADVPILATEFSFGALDRGMLWPGLGPASDQADRAALLKHYVRSALANPSVVGVHWFAYNSQPTTGRGDGENGQIGLVDVCDTPYAETAAALRELSREIYRLRASGAR